MFKFDCERTYPAIANPNEQESRMFCIYSFLVPKIASENAPWQTYSAHELQLTAAKGRRPKVQLKSTHHLAPN